MANAGCTVYRCAEYDGFTKTGTLATISSVLLALFIMYYTGFIYTVFGVLLAAALLVILASVYMLTPRSCMVCSDKLVVKRLWRSIIIPYQSVTLVLKIEFGLQSSYRLLGGSGFFGYIGFYDIEGYGRAYVYATNRFKAVLIRLAGGKQYIISPRDPEKFISDVTSRIKAFQAR